MRRGVREPWKRTLCIVVCVLGGAGLALGLVGCDWLFNRAPEAGFAISPSTGGTAPFAVNFTATATDRDNDDLEYSWAFGDSTAPGAGSSVNHTYTTTGTFVVVLTVTDSHGASSIAQREVYVAAAPPAGPTARIFANPTSGTSPLSVSFDASGSSYTVASIAAYEWAFGDGGTSTGRNVSHTYVSSGSRTYTVTLTVRAADGTSGMATTQIVVSAGGGGGDTPIPGSPSARFVANKTTGTAPLQVEFDPADSEADVGRTLVAYAWSFGDGSSASSATATKQTHVYVTSEPAEVFSVTLVVIDNAGASSTITKTVRVENEHPIAGFQIYSVATANGAATPTGGTWLTDDMECSAVQSTSAKVWIRSLKVGDPKWIITTSAAPTPASGTPTSGTPPSEAYTTPAYADHNYSYDPEGQYWTAGKPAWFPNDGWGIEHFDIAWGDGSSVYNVNFTGGGLDDGIGHVYNFTGALVKTITVTAYDYLGGKSSYERTVTLSP